MHTSYTRLAEMFKRGCHKLKFATSKDERDEVLSEIRVKIRKLERILAASDQVAAFEGPSKLAVSRRSANTLVGYWRHADRVFALLRSSWVCPCRQEHCAHLWLQHRTSAHFEFRMLVMFAPANSNPSQLVPWQQHGLKIEWTSLSDPVAKQMMTNALTPAPPKSVLPSAVAGKLSKPGILSTRKKTHKPTKATIK